MKGEPNKYITTGKATGLLVGLVSFVVLWSYCVTTYGFWLGVGLGWLPSLIGAFLCGGLTVILWPIVLLVLAVAVIAVIFIVLTH